MEDLETFFLQKIKPYEERIQQLEESEKSKELEIVTLKHAIQNLNRIIEQLKASQPAATKPGARPIGGKTTGVGAKAGAPHEEEKKTSGVRRPGTSGATGSSAKDTAPTKPGAKDLHKPGKGTKAEPPKTGKDAKKDVKAEPEKKEEEPEKKAEEHHEEPQQAEPHKEEGGEAEKKEEGEGEKKEGAEEPKAE